MSNGAPDRSSCTYFRFGLVVTGKTEKAHIPLLFWRLMATKICTFEVISFVGQLDPITSPKRLAVTGTKKRLPTKYDERIGFPAKRYLLGDPCRYVIVLDDLEPERRSQAQQVWERYRQHLLGLWPRISGNGHRYTFS